MKGLLNKLGDNNRIWSWLFTSDNNIISTINFEWIISMILYLKAEKSHKSEEFNNLNV